MVDHERELRHRFGLPSFRPWQREAIEALLDGPRQALVVAPTGGGKSLCYQYPATVLEGTTVVVSPLIALMDDQVRGLEERGIAATYLASTLDFEERRRREARLAEGGYDLVYVAPEALRNGWLLNLLDRMRPPLLAVDEAHCISQWGHDFRPDYLRIGEVLRSLRPGRVLACTATATPHVRDEIVQRLGLSADCAVVLRGFARPNLHLEVEELDGWRVRSRLALDRVRRELGAPGPRDGAAIVYAGTRKNTEKLAALFDGEGYRSAAYHAGLEATEREQVSAAFAAGELRVVVATNAFGMGIDRPDIRLVAHVQAPGSIEQYYQEVGRAGRDGAPAHGLLIAGSSDFAFRRRLLQLDQNQGAALAERQWKLFLDLMRYVEAGSCRHDFILRYFGDEGEVLGGCGHCDVCARLDDEGERAITDDDVLVVRKALSGVARLRGRAGLTILSQHLHGDDNQRLRQLGVTSLSTHGILADHPTPWIMAVIRRLLTANLVDVTADDFPVPFLTKAGRAVMKGDQPVRVLMPSADVGQKKKRSKGSRKKASQPAAELSGEDAALFERLRSARASIAKDKGVPAYVVCHNRTLEEIAARRPTNAAELADVHGMGPARVEAYGADLLAVVTGG